MGEQKTCPVCNERPLPWLPGVGGGGTHNATCFECAGAAKREIKRRHRVEEAAAKMKASGVGRRLMRLAEEHRPELGLGAQLFVESAKPVWLWIHGARGTGKSTLAVALMRHMLLERDWPGHATPVRYVSLALLDHELRKRSWSMDDYITCPVLIVDEAARQRQHFDARTHERLRELVHARHDDDLRTVFVSCLGLEELGAEAQKAGGVMGAWSVDMVDRVMEMVDDGMMVEHLERVYRGGVR